MTLSQRATASGALVWQHSPAIGKTHQLKETAMKNVYPRLYPSLFFGLILFKGYLLATL